MMVVVVVSDCLGNIRDQTGGWMAPETLEPGVGDEQHLKTC